MMNDRGVSYLMLMVFAAAVSVGLMSLSEFSLNQFKKQVQLNNRLETSDLLDSIRTVMSRPEYCDSAILNSEGNPLHFDAEAYAGAGLEIAQIKFNSETIAAKNQVVGRFLKVAKIALKPNPAKSPSNFGALKKIYPSLITFSFGSTDSTMIVSAPKTIPISLIVDNATQEISSCVPAFRRMQSALATRKGFTLHGIGCNKSSTGTIPSDRYEANTCDSTVDPGICDSPANQSLAVSGHPYYVSYSATPAPNQPLTIWGQFFPKRQAALPANYPAGEGRCWFTPSSGLPPKPGSDPPRSWYPSEIFVMPNAASGLMTLGCRMANGWVLSGCVRKSYSKNNSADADVQIAKDGDKNEYCFTDNTRTPHLDGRPWSSFLEQLQAICIRADDL